MTDTTNTELRQRTNQSTYMDSDEVEEDQDLVMGDKEHLLRGDNLREMKGEDHQRERISNMNVTVFGWTFNKVIAVIHLNIFLYATCFWIQTGTMPVGNSNRCSKSKSYIICPKINLTRFLFTLFEEKNVYIMFWCWCQS